ncbi:reverse transcriptase domain-containing protein [Tanacetum coccineum]
MIYKNAFGLKNASAIVQRLIDNAFDNQVGRNIEVYVDDLVIKSHTEAEMLRDIDETFCTLRKINMKLNPKKCTFGAVKGIFLGYMITPEGIKSCPSKTEAVLQLPSPLDNQRGPIATTTVLVEILKEKSIQEKEVATVVEEEGPTWMTPIMDYLKDGTLPGDRKEASKLRIKARQYELLEGFLYKWLFLKPWLRCVGQLQADYMIREIHEGSCSMHARPRYGYCKNLKKTFKTEQSRTRERN